MLHFLRVVCLVLAICPYDDKMKFFKNGGSASDDDRAVAVSDFSCGSVRHLHLGVSDLCPLGVRMGNVRPYATIRTCYAVKGHMNFKQVKDLNWSKEYIWVAFFSDERLEVFRARPGFVRYKAEWLAQKRTVTLKRPISLDHIEFSCLAPERTRREGRYV